MVYTNNNGKSYELLAYNKQADYAVLKNVNNDHDYVACWGATSFLDGAGYWAQGHYFCEYESAMAHYNEAISKVR